MPGLTVVEGATLVCPAGSQSVSLTVTTNAFVTIDGLLVATIDDMVPDENIPAFGTCEILSGLAGAPTNCVPALAEPWAPGSVTQDIDGLPVLTMPATCNCSIGGVITIAETPQVVEVSD